MNVQFILDEQFTFGRLKKAVALTMTIITTNGWNRLAVSFRKS
jgi:hypothetical protein